MTALAYSNIPVHSFSILFQLSPHSLWCVFINDEHSHVFREEFARVANVDSSLLLVTSQHPDLDVSLV